MSEIKKIADLKPGMVIVQITQQNGPVKIRKSGLVTSDAMVQGLAEMGVLEVEVDPAQTVEIDKPVHHRTQTQALIRGEHDTTARALDSNLSDQFNRSLFLPTVQGLPSMWKVYSRQVLSFAAVIFAGLLVGSVVGSFPAWWQNLSGITITTGTPAGADAKQETSTEAPANKPEPASNEPDGSEIANVTSQTQQALNASTPSQQNSGESGGVTQQPVSTPQPVPAPTNAPATAPTENQYAGEVLNAPQESNVDVSPELMARFNKAIEELDDKATDEKPSEQVIVRDNLPRVDQLPVRMLTRLPSMAFSAHMYASRPSDRWVRVNGQQLGEGDWIGSDVQIVKIEAQRVILSFEGKEFSMAALTDW